MTEEILQYQTLVETALRSVVRKALAEVAQYGLPGEHHFYITFDTRLPGVELPAYLRETYPDEMTMVLQHQFSNLTVDEEHFQVILSFNGRPEVIRVPLSAISIFADPSVNFALQFQNFAQVPDAGEEEQDSLPDEENEGGAEVISLDQFRKHK
ncbi:MAG TPA: hypothetical protein DCW68_00950 [Rhodospirillaceae bacterium]|nr:MAG: hypothetical protein A2018_00660 [Alphaproteobacteria bacterium GWF2_58_20]HAU28667.1 hypothetical protein [Rhodospirillaceae bacterium]